MLFSLSFDMGKDVNPAGYAHRDELQVVEFCFDTASEPSRYVATRRVSSVPLQGCLPATGTMRVVGTMRVSHFLSSRQDELPGPWQPNDLKMQIGRVCAN